MPPHLTNGKCLTRGSPDKSIAIQTLPGFSETTYEHKLNLRDTAAMGRPMAASGVHVDSPTKPAHMLPPNHPLHVLEQVVDLVENS